MPVGSSPVCLALTAVKYSPLDRSRRLVARKPVPAQCLRQAASSSEVSRCMRRIRAVVAGLIQRSRIKKQDGLPAVVPPKSKNAANHWKTPGRRSSGECHAAALVGVQRRKLPKQARPLARVAPCRAAPGFSRDPPPRAPVSVPGSPPRWSRRWTAHYGIAVLTVGRNTATADH